MPDPLQPDLFSAWPEPPSGAAPAAVPARELSDEALIAALPDATLGDARALAAEAGQRRLQAAVPALAALCARFVGYGADAPVPEQTAALEALAAIGGAEASRAVGRLVERKIVQGPNLVAATAVASDLGVLFSAPVALALLRHAEPSVRASACACARAGPDVIAALLETLGDRDADTAAAAACALGRMGRTEARNPLKRRLRERPTRRVVEALAEVADEEAIVLLARLGRARADLAQPVLSALEAIDEPKTAAAAAALRDFLARGKR